MTIEAVVRSVEFATDEPLGEGWVPLQGFAERLEPVHFPGAFGPKSFRICSGTSVQSLILRKAFNLRLLAKTWRRGELAILAKDRGNILRFAALFAAHDRLNLAARLAGPET